MRALYLHLGQETLVRTRDIIGIFDLDSSTLGRDTRAFLARGEKSGQVVNVSQELPKSYVLTSDSETQIFISQLNSTIIKNRLKIPINSK